MAHVTSVYQIVGETLAKLNIDADEPISVTLNKGTVVMGEEASCTVTEVSQNTYRLDFVLPKGSDGTNASLVLPPPISISSVTAIDHESSPSAVLNANNDGSYDLALYIPKGQTGDAQTPPTINITTSNVGSNVNPSKTLTSNANGSYNLNVNIPNGVNGADGEDGVVPYVEMGTYTSGAAGTNATGSLDKIGNSYYFNFVVPQGEDGEDSVDGNPPSIEGGPTTGVASTANSTFVLENNGSSYTMTIGAQRGTSGATGSAGTSATIPTFTTANVSSISDPTANARASFVSTTSGLELRAGIPIGSSGASGTSGTNGAVGNFQLAAGHYGNGDAALVSIINSSYTPGSQTLYSMGWTYPNGSRGSSGANGTNGTIPTFLSGTRTVVTYTSDVYANLTSSGNASYVINLYVPSGSPGLSGTSGTPGTTPVLKAGTVSYVASGTNASASLTTSGNSYTLNLWIPSGLSGTSGTSGALGPKPTVSFGTVSFCASSTSSFTMTSSGSAYTINLGIPSGASGTGGTAGGSPVLTSVTYNSQAAGSTPSATLTSSGNNYALTLWLPKGANGADGTAVNSSDTTNAVAPGSSATTTAVNGANLKNLCKIVPRCNTVALITASGSFVAPITGYYTVILCGGGGGALNSYLVSSATGMISMFSIGWPGAGGNIERYYCSMTSGQKALITIGAGGAPCHTSAAFYSRGLGGSSIFEISGATASNFKAAGSLPGQGVGNVKTQNFGATATSIGCYDQRPFSFPARQGPVGQYNQGYQMGSIGGANGLGFGGFQSLTYRKNTGGGGATATHANGTRVGTNTAYIGSANLSGAAGFCLIVYGKYF